MTYEDLDCLDVQLQRSTFHLNGLQWSIFFLIVFLPEIEVWSHVERGWIWVDREEVEEVNVHKHGPTQSDEILQITTSEQHHFAVRALFIPLAAMHSSDH